MNKVVALNMVAAAAIFVVTGCTQHAPSAVTAQTAAQNDDASAPAASTAPAAPAAPVELPLSYSWSTAYDGFVNAPVEIVRQGRAACQQRGFEVASIGTIALDGDMATATFICHGDVE